MNTDLIASMSAAPATWLNVAELPSPTIGTRSPVFGIGRVMHFAGLREQLLAAAPTRRPPEP